MATVPLFVGLDYHMKSVQVCVIDAEGHVMVNRRCGNSVAEIGAMVSPLGVPAKAALESCCGAADLAEQLKQQLHWPVALAHPGHVARMRHNPDKTDLSDARLLAELCGSGFLPEVWLAPAVVRELRLLVRFRADQVDRRRVLKLRVLALLRHQRVVEPHDGGRWTRRWLAWLREDEHLSPAGRWMCARHLEELAEVDRRIDQIERRLAETTAEDALTARLRELPGVGPVTAWTMRAVIGRFDRFRTGKELARFCAVTPRNASSGQRMADAGLIRAGDPLLKGVLIQAAHRLQRHDQRWARAAAAMKARGKPAGVVTAAIANRWVRWMFHQLKEVPQAA